MTGSVQQRIAVRPANPAPSLARRPGGAQHLYEARVLAGAYAFVQQAGVGHATLVIAAEDARQAGVAVHEVLLAAGYITAPAYAAALARWLQVPCAGWEHRLVLDPPLDFDDPDDRPLRGRLDGQPCVFLCAEASSPQQIAARVSLLRQQGVPVALSWRMRLETALDAELGAARIEAAVHGLRSLDPTMSAAGPIWLRQVIFAMALVGLTAGGAAVHPEATLFAVSVLIALPFLCVTLLRLAALWEVITGPRMVQRHKLTTAMFRAENLPYYSVLVPLFREANVLPGLVQSLRSLEYPKAKLEVVLILEAADTETQTAVLEMSLPANFRTIVVPGRGPQTKPKALNYALQYARGDYIVVYDAEDRPEPDQLLRAVSAFERLPADVGCLQARLNVHNSYSGWLSRQFTIEYSALFDAILPALARMGLPVPLGGTSNHFRRHVLVSCGAWDPYNVTEDADLGLRLARRGWRTAILASTTWEEAPVSLRQWMGQRTRWLKGWMQTYLVHTRQLRKLHRELRWRAAFGLHAMMGALLLSALVHPWFYALLAYHLWSGAVLAGTDTIAGAAFWMIAGTNLVAGYASAILIGALSVWRRGWRRLALSALTMPVLWLLISFAAYRALIELILKPHHWEKTEHGRTYLTLRTIRRC